MKDLSLHILDIVQNSVKAGADNIEINILEDRKGWLNILIKDNGSGIEKKALDKITDPFYTTGNKKTGLGLPLLEQRAIQTGGSLHVVSEKGKGTLVSVEFFKNHIDMPPLGEMAKTMKILICSNPGIRFKYIHRVRTKVFSLDTEEVKNILGDVSIANNEILRFIEDMISGNLQRIGAEWMNPEIKNE
jgi:anti-sigma regulatory factor (Ser/Thr protein kinase)